MTDEQKLGFVVPRREKVTPDAGRSPAVVNVHGVNTRTSLWPERWPVIALQECIDKVEAAPPEEQAEVKFNLPCRTCEKNSACLSAKRKEIGPLLYDREILTKARSSESSLFPERLFAPLLVEGQPLQAFWHKPFSLEHHYKVVQAWDLAWSEKLGGDWLVCMTARVDLRTGERYLLDIERWQRVSFQEQTNLIVAKWQLFKADMVVIETDAAQQIWAKHVGETTPVPVARHTGATKRDFAVGVPGLLIKLENRKWRFPHLEGSYHWEELNTFFSEIEAFGWVDGSLEGVGEHDDTVMAWWHLDWGIDQWTQAATGAAGGEHHRGMQDTVRQ